MSFRLLSILFCLLLANSVFGAKWKASNNVRQGNNLYQEKKYDNALEKYNAAQNEAPDSPEIQFNMADVFYRQGKYNEAIDSYAKALEHGKRFGAKTHYNTGNALFRQGRFQEALDAYKRSLELVPHDLDTKYNIEFTQRKMKEMTSQAAETEEKATKERQERKQKGQQQGAESKQEQGAQDKSADGGEKQTRQEKGNQESAEATKKGEQNQKDKGQTEEPGELSREDAERILGAMENEEKNLPRIIQLNRNQTSEQGTEKDW